MSCAILPTGSETFTILLCAILWDIHIVIHNHMGYFIIISIQIIVITLSCLVIGRSCDFVVLVLAKVRIVCHVAKNVVI